MARKAGYVPPSQPPPETPLTGKQEAELRDTREELQVWLIRHSMVTIWTWIFAAVAVYGLIVKGIGGALAGLFLIWLCRQFKPPPSDRLDKYTGR